MLIEYNNTREVATAPWYFVGQLKKVGQWSIYLKFKENIDHFGGLVPLHDDVIKWNFFRVTGPLWGKFTGHRWIPFTKASDAKLWFFLWSAPEQTVE